MVVEARSSHLNVENWMLSARHPSTLHVMHTAKSMVPAPYLQRENIAFDYIAKKRVSSFASNHSAKTLPKRQRTIDPCAMSPEKKERTRRNSYALAVASEQKKLSAAFYTPTATRQQSQGLSFIPVNQNRKKETETSCSNYVVCGRSTSQKQSTPPYGSHVSSSFSRMNSKSNRWSITNRLSRKAKKAPKSKRRVLANKQTIQDHNANNTGNSELRASAVFVYNAHLRQKESTEANNQTKQGDDEDHGYSPGFAPKLTSTPMHKTPDTRDSSSEKPTSDYFSKPGSSETTSSKSTQTTHDSFSEFLKFINSGKASKIPKRVNTQGTSKRTRCSSLKESSQDNRGSAYSSKAHGDASKATNGGFYRKRFLTSTPEQESTTHSFFPQASGKPPGMFPLGIPSATSSPVVPQPSHSMVSGDDQSTEVWRPWKI